jgi:hypothetical protein
MKPLALAALLALAASPAACTFRADQRATWSPREAQCARRADLRTPEGRAAALARSASFAATGSSAAAHRFE